MSPESDVAAVLATRLRSVAGLPELSADDLWPALGALADAGYVVGDEERLGARQLGPFRVATTRYGGAIADFVDVAVPSIVGGWATGSTSAGALAGVVGSLCKTFVELSRHGVVFGRSRAAQVRWTVMSALCQPAARGLGLHLDELAAQASLVVLDGRPIAPAEVDAALAWLANDDGVRGERKAPLVRRAEGNTFRAIV